MRNLKRFLVSMTVLAGFSALFSAPAAQADERVDLGQLSLRPANVRGAGFSAQQQAYLLGPASDESRCLDADLGTINGNGTKIQLWTCIINPDNTIPANQAWYITQIPEGHYRFQNVHNGRYLDADLGSINRNGTKIQLWDYMAGGSNQWFTVTENPEGFLRLQNVRSGRYLDSDLGTAGRDGGVVQLWDYVAGAKNQWWF
ncbi:RICIN domain-containing protein [Amycolatopsis sp. BJA-103]|uniref:RICIN domain-containing protein n=1 Tax=unclassified Amycolatopsis TaxID=2618356 RepID=UPI000CA13E30|nr:RICIN domain-containing protein [Amycolatopsis sp. BJA-103]AUI57912.1 protease B [Amycolatopsis sp. BJA-103]PNE15803.1 protease B [Amycolatopsis sp. BJA-103]